MFQTTNQYSLSFTPIPWTILGSVHSQNLHPPFHQASVGHRKFMEFKRWSFRISCHFWNLKEPNNELWCLQFGYSNQDVHHSTWFTVFSCWPIHDAAHHRDTDTWRWNADDFAWDVQEKHCWLIRIEWCWIWRTKACNPRVDRSWVESPALSAFSVRPSRLRQF